MPARVNNHRAADELRREYNVLGDRLRLQVDDVVVPVAIVADLSVGSSGVPIVRRAYSAFSQAAVVAEYTQWRFETPPGIIAVVTRVLVQAPAAQLARVRWGSSITAPANVATKQFMDGRLREAGLVPQCTLASGTNVGAMGNPQRYLQADAVPGIEHVVEWVVGRDDGQYDFIEFSSFAVNEAMAGFVEWDEVAVTK